MSVVFVDGGQPGEPWREVEFHSNIQFSNGDMKKWKGLRTNVTRGYRLNVKLQFCTVFDFPVSEK